LKKKKKEVEEADEEEEEEEDPYPKTEEPTAHFYKPVSFHPFIWP
jgi:hypothetical protein